MLCQKDSLSVIQVSGPRVLVSAAELSDFRVSLLLPFFLVQYDEMIHERSAYWLKEHSPWAVALGLSCHPIIQSST